ncbi:vinorine synthase-like [Camellia sinensis]|uniref:vinorine synthase-like n=1 Tax=Camellia sinensis TaxID=4442 RepID=UPI001036341B|nr:vinorine synthase-like [Camellia sinensis]
MRSLQEEYKRSSEIQIVMAMEVEIISTEAIKPSSPTPNHLKTFKISLLDQLVAHVFSKQIYFYLPSSPECAEIESKLKLLKSSLSQILSLFYPFAGSITANFSVDCNDDRAIFVEARARCHLSQILNQPSEIFLRKFLPLNNIQSNDGDSSSPLLLIQSTFFECGGAAIGLLFHHKMTAAAAMATFITAWASAARGESVSPPELLSGPTLFPPKDFLANANLPTSSSEKTSVKRFVFSSSSIGNLKSEVAGKTIHQHQPPPQPTQVEAVSALIWKCATKASRSNSQTKPTVLLQSVNLRTRFNPPLPKNSMGNMVGYYPVTTSDDEIDTGKADEECLRCWWWRPIRLIRCLHLSLISGDLIRIDEARTSHDLSSGGGEPLARKQQERHRVCLSLFFKEGEVICSSSM